jgi:hypothetical protein
MLPLLSDLEREILKKAAAFRPGNRRAVGEDFGPVAAEKRNFPVAGSARASWYRAGTGR